MAQIRAQVAGDRKEQDHVEHDERAEECLTPAEERARDAVGDAR